MATNTGYTVPIADAGSYIKYGQKGDRVKELQGALNAQGFKLSTDGIFGPNTLSALKQFQSKAGVSSDGIYGPQTMGAFNKLSAQTTTPPPVNTNLSATGGVSSVPVATGVQTGAGATITPTAPQQGEFNYDYTKDPLYVAQSKLVQGQIAEQMAARGILNSTIDQETVAQAIAGLGLQYKEQAFSQYSQQQGVAFQREQFDYNKIQDQMAAEIKARQNEIDQAWNRVNSIGYVSNEDAKILGLPPGTSTMAAKKQAADIAKDALSANAKEEYKEGTSLTYTATAKAFPTNFANAFTKEEAMNYVKYLRSLAQSGKITEQEYTLILVNAPVSGSGDNALRLLEEIINAEKGGSAIDGGLPADGGSSTSTTDDSLSNPSRAMMGQIK